MPLWKLLALQAVWVRQEKKTQPELDACIPFWIMTGLQTWTALPALTAGQS